MNPRKLDGLGESKDLQIWPRLQSAALAIACGYFAYWAYRKIDRKTRKKNRKVFRTKHKTRSVLGRKMSSRAMRIARATTLPMRMLRKRGSKSMKLKAEDWVTEQIKMRQLTRKAK